jgi:hypothetical protein
MPNLQTLDVSHNMITDINACSAIKQCPLLKSFDARDNQSANGEDFEAFFKELPTL